jgi:5-methylcytosine-specific restriction endonuclease McrA
MVNTYTDYYQKCLICGDKFKPEILPNWFRFCSKPDCVEKGREKVLNNVKQLRYIPTSFFDLYRDRILEKGNTWHYPACANCGIALEKANGQPPMIRKTCPKCPSLFELNHWWNLISEAFYNSKKGEDGFARCEQCGVKDDKKYMRFAVHHKKPIYSLTFDEIGLIWDKNNLILLCPDCHGKAHKEYNKKQKIKKKRKGFKPLDTFMEMKRRVE